MTTKYQPNEANPYTRIEVSESAPTAESVVVKPQFDALGNLLSDGRYTYTWDAKNRMTSVTLGTDTWTFQYDGQNRRIAESKNGVPLREWVWNNTQIVEERTVAGGGKQRRWTGGVELLNSSNQQTAKRLLITDHLGSSRAAIDGTSGTTTASYAFSPWGKRSRISGTEDLSNGYTGHLWHESGLSLAVYRPYDPETGRWPARDPIGEQGGRNLFKYSNNDPISKLDYYGHKAGCFCGPDITSALKRTMLAVDEAWSGLPANVQENVCDTMLGAGTMAWDITDLKTMFSGRKSRSECAQTVQVNGECHYTGSVNYILFGRMVKHCGSSSFAAKFWITFWKHSAGNYGKSKEWSDVGHSTSGSQIGATPKGDRSSCRKTSAAYTNVLHGVVGVAGELPNLTW